ncbi:zinc-binding protein A33-like [Heterodontus francisci]|uniref:zinc-binding protein A33-like n=1 Tax=Heterodontus francisci TaxID=7792 RepID=UPI00355B248C
MASEYKTLEAELDCPICSTAVTDAVTFECGHTFCRDCIADYQAKDGRTFCPKCSMYTEPKKQKDDQVSENLVLRPKDPSVAKKGKTGSHLICEEHQEEVKLFCETERKLICVNCLDRRDEKSHTAHNFMLLNEAADIYKEKMNTVIFSLKQRKTSFQDFELKQQESISEVKEQSNKLQSLIDSEFSKLRSLLDEKERNLFKELQAEKEDILGRMETNLREIRDNSQDTQQRLSFIEMQLNEKDAVSLLMVTRLTCS